MLNYTDFNKLLFIIILTVALYSPLSSARFEDDEAPLKNKIEISFIPGILFGGSYDYEEGYGTIKPGPSVEGIFAWYVKRYGRLFLSYDHQFTHLLLKPQTSTMPSATVKAITGSMLFGGETDIPLKYRTIPFVGMGVGTTYLLSHIEGAKPDFFFLASFFGGIKFPINKTVGLRMNFKLLITIPSGNSSSMCIEGHGCKVSVFVDTVGRGEFGLGIYLLF
ncbi:MAG: hypothetical protein JXR91_00250 [Deltaproteobacteria bacterium]|nr:hypothetical protein [Deltaproteobacteria bacterium]